MRSVGIGLGHLWVRVEKDDSWLGPYVDHRWDEILAFARIGSGHGSTREVWVGARQPQRRVRVYAAGKRAWPDDVTPDRRRAERLRYKGTARYGRVPAPRRRQLAGADVWEPTEYGFRLIAGEQKLVLTHKAGLWFWSVSRADSGVIVARGVAVTSADAKSKAETALARCAIGPLHDIATPTRPQRAAHRREAVAKLQLANALMAQLGDAIRAGCCHEAVQLLHHWIDATTAAVRHLTDADEEGEARRVGNESAEVLAFTEVAVEACGRRPMAGI